MAEEQILAGFHAVKARLRHAPDSLMVIHVDQGRRDRRMTALVDAAAAAGVRVQPVDAARLDTLSRGVRHQGVLARARALALAVDVDELLDDLEARGEPALLLLLDGVTDPHNLGACLRSADGAGAHAVIAPRDRAVGLNATVRRVACGAAETVPYITVTNLARTMRALKERDIWLIGTDDQADTDYHGVDVRGAIAWVMGAEGEGMRRLTRETCDERVRIPMAGAVESLNVSVASALCLYETVRQRG
ncbi:MAG: 23S rRNA (guanosine(2251)-2'-O)-methyltransferase RlmB [Castellaniella sp.]